MKLGIRKNDRINNQKLKLFKGWGKDVVNRKILEVKTLFEKNELKEHPSDLLEAIVRNSLQNREQKKVYDEESIFDEFNTFFMAGVDTTSNYLAMAIYLLAQNPKVEQKVREEIQEHMKEEDFA